MIPRDPKDKNPGMSGVRPSPPEKDWKLPDPTQRKRESKSVDISKVSRQTRQDELSKLTVYVFIFLIAITVVAAGAYISLHTELIGSGKKTAPTKVAVEWARDKRAIDAFDRELLHAAQLPEEPLQQFSQRYWDLEEGKKGKSADESIAADFENQQNALWKESLKGKDIIALDIKLNQISRTTSDAEVERFQISASRSEKELPDGGIRQVELLFLTKIPGFVLTNDRLVDLSLNNRSAQILLSPYYTESSAESNTMRATELKHESGHEFKPMNTWVSFINAKIAIHCDLIGLRILPDPKSDGETFFKVVVGDTVAGS